MAKTILMLLGSGRRNGNTEGLANAFAEGARKRGYEIESLFLRDKDLKPCLSCRRCWSAPDKPCVIEDDMYLVYPRIEAADVVAFVSPLYFFSWSGSLKTVWDRLLPFIPRAQKNLVGKSAVLIAAAGDEEPEVFDGLETSYGIAVNYMKMADLGRLMIPGIHAPEDYKKGDSIERALEFGESMPAA